MWKYVFLSLAISSSFQGFGQDPRVEQVLSEFRTDSLQQQVLRLSGEVPVIINGHVETIVSRLYNQPGNELAFKYAKEQFERFGLETDSQVFSVRGKNLFGIKKGTIFPERVCIIGAHYDNLPTGTVAPGADDNASGCAAVLEAARIMSHYDFPNTVIFAWWDEEELGLIGSAAYVAQPKIHGDSLLGYINLDMLAWDGNDDNLSEIHTRPVANSLQLMQMLIDCNQLYGIGLNLKVVNPGAINSDHYSFWQKGYTAVGLNEEYTGDFNPNHHLVSDKFSVFNLDYFTSNSRLALAFFATLAWNKSGDLSDAEVIGSAVVFPNPSTDAVHLQFSQVVLNQIRVAVSDNLGRIVFDGRFEKVDQVTIPADQLGAGFYRITIHSGDSRQNLSFIKH